MNKNYLAVKQQFYSTVIADILRAVDGGSNGGALILTFCCIDYMGFAMRPIQEKNTRNKFIQYVQTYMSRINSLYKILGHELYAIRCSFIHVYGASYATEKLNIIPSVIFSSFDKELHLNYPKVKGEITILLPEFISDVITSVELFFLEMQDDSTNLHRWKEVLYYHRGIMSFFEKQEIAQSNIINYKKIHPILEILSNISKPSLATIQSHISILVNQKISNYCL